MAKGKASGRGKRKTAARPSDPAIAKGLVTLETDRELPPSPLEIPPRAEGVPPSEMLTLGRMVETNGGSSLEPVEGFDIVRARNAGLFPTIVPAEAGAADSEGYLLENGTGNRTDLVRVPDTTALPWRSIAMLTITYQNGGQGIGTAWFFSEKALATAGHNIFHPFYGMATEILVTPAYGSNPSFDTHRVATTYCDPQWLNGNHEAALDYGVLLIDDAAVGRRLGWFGFAAYEDRRLNRILLNVSGYSNDRTPRTQYYNGGRVQDVDRQFLRYAFKTEGG